MSTTVKVLLIVLGAGLVLVFGLIGAFVWWIDSNKEGLERMRETTVAEARAFAATQDNAACLAAALGRTDGCEELDVMCQAQARIFLDTCLESSTPTEGFCDGVPPGDAILDTASYRIAKCRSLGRDGDGPCGRLLTAIQSHCAHPR